MIRKSFFKNQIKSQAFFEIKIWRNSPPLLFRFKKHRLKNERCPFVTCVYFASGSKCGLSTPLTSGELAAGKLVLFIALHSSSLALGKDGLSLTGGQKTQRREDSLRSWKRLAQAAAPRPD